MADTNVVPGPGFLLMEKVAELQGALLESHPKMPTLLREIYITLKKQPENVTLFTPEHIRVLVTALEKQTGIQLVDSLAKKSSGTKAKMADIKKQGLDAF